MPTIETMIAKAIVAPSTVPATFFTRCSSPAPYACPINTVLPLAMPIRNEKSRKTIGKTADTAANALTPIIRPRKIEAKVCEADCRMLLIINGTRKINMICHIGLDSSKIFMPIRRAGDACDIRSTPLGAVTGNSRRKLRFSSSCRGKLGHRDAIG